MGARYSRGRFHSFGSPIAGHGTKWEDLNRSTREDWYDSATAAFSTLKENCDRVFVGGFSAGGALALKLSQLRGIEIEGLILLNPSIFDDRKIFKLLPLLKHVIPSIKGGASDVAKPGAPIHGYGRFPLRALDSLRELWKQVESDLYLVDNPLLIGYSINDHVVDPTAKQLLTMCSHQVFAK
ncbi:MAG: alpha/beta hydrolase [Actinomycetota bacterium]